MRLRFGLGVFGQVRIGGWRRLLVLGWGWDLVSVVVVVMVEEGEVLCLIFDVVGRGYITD